MRSDEKGRVGFTACCTKETCLAKIDKADFKFFAKKLGSPQDIDQAIEKY